MPEPTISDPPKTVPAATVVIFRHAPEPGGAPELLMVQRAKEMRFAGGAAVFPGGRIDAADRELAARLAPGADPDVSAARVAGMRETLEETGLAIALGRQVAASEAADARAHLMEQGVLAPVLERFGWTLELDRLVPFARWCPQMDGAFDTRFFLTDLGTGAVDVAVDATENTRLFWASAGEVLRRAEEGDVYIIFPTRRNLERLAQFASFVEARDHAEAIPVRMISPQRIERDGEAWLTIPEGLGYPVTAQSMATVRRG
jgi:8-oxo-dGTP pyrophosphatase MutT (NUDIX family)